MVHLPLLCLWPLGPWWAVDMDRSTPTSFIPNWLAGYDFSFPPLPPLSDRCAWPCFNQTAASFLILSPLFLDRCAPTLYLLNWLLAAISPSPLFHPHSWIGVCHLIFTKLQLYFLSLSPLFLDRCAPTSCSPNWLLAAVSPPLQAYATCYPWPFCPHLHIHIQQGHPPLPRLSWLLVESLTQIGPSQPHITKLAAGCYFFCVFCCFYLL